MSRKWFLFLLLSLALMWVFYGYGWYTIYSERYLIISQRGSIGLVFLGVLVILISIVIAAILYNRENW